MEELNEYAPQPVRAGRPALRWLPVVIFGILSLALLAAAGFVNGTIEWDVPWPATQRENDVFALGRALLWSGIGVLIVALATAFLPFAGQHPGQRAAKGVLLCVALVVVAFGFVMIGYTVGHTHFLFALTSA